MPSTKRARKQNPVPFIQDEDHAGKHKKRTKPSKIHQKEQKVISSNMSGKILKEALEQQKEILEEEVEERNPSFAALDEEHLEVENEEDIDNFQGFEENKSFFDCEEEVDEDDEKLLDAFLLKSGRQQTLADVIAQKIKEKDAAVSANDKEVPQLPKMDSKCIELYKGVGKYLKEYTAGKLPIAVKFIPKTQEWEHIVHLTEPEKWSPNALYQVTRIFASNMGVKKAERFYKLVLLPRVREDIRKNKRLHFALYQSLKKCLYKPAAFSKGILFPLCESRTCNLREAVIIGSIIQKVSIPPLHSSVAIMKLAEMEYCGTTSYIVKLLFEKKYALPYRVLDAAVEHFMRFVDEERVMPVIWHQSLLAFVQRYKNELTKEDKKNLRFLLQVQNHKLVTPEIHNELNSSRNRGEKEPDPMTTDDTVSILRKPIEEDRFDIPPVSMEED